MYFNSAQFLAYANTPSVEHVRREVRWELGGNTGYSGGSAWAATDGTTPLTEEEAERYLSSKLEAIANRDEYSVAGRGTGKWYRPWDVVPELKNWSAPEGDYGVGVEVEMGFITREGAQQVAQHVKDWEYITLDYEGGDIPIEATFPPVAYSEFGNSYAMQYLAYLKENEELVYDHDVYASVGTHVNVSVGGGKGIPYHRVDQLYNVLSDEFDSNNLQMRYFGRPPYDYCFGMGGNWQTSEYRYVEFKLFNSQLEPARLQQYVDEAVSLVKLMMSDEEITTRSVHIALEEGYALRASPVTANVSNAVEPVALAIAA